MTYEEFQKLDPASSELDKLADKGQAIYREKIRPLVYPQHKGRMVVLDILTGDWEMDDQAIVASERLRERRPKAIDFTVRIGYKASISFGGRRILEEEC